MRFSLTQRTTADRLVLAIDSRDDHARGVLAISREDQRPGCKLTQVRRVLVDPLLLHKEAFQERRR